MRAPGNWGRDYQRDFDAIYPRLAEKYHVALYPFILDGVALDPALSQADGLHPNAKGVAVIVARLAPAVESLLEGRGQGQLGGRDAAPLRRHRSSARAEAQGLDARQRRAGGALGRCRELSRDLALHRRGRRGCGERHRRGARADPRAALRAGAAGVGNFGTRALWVGVERNPALSALHDKIESAIVRAGFEPEGRRYAPHVSLARLKYPAEERIQAFLAQHALFRAEPFAVAHFSLIASYLTKSGAIYEDQADYALK